MTAKVWPEVRCTRPAVVGETFGSACPECGHTNLVHPNPTVNPALRCCVICQMLGYPEREHDEQVR